MRKYEGVFIFPPDSTADARRKQEKDLEDILSKFEGAVLNKTEVGKKTLGYAVRKSRDGFVFIYDFQMNPGKLTDCRKALDLFDDLMKYMITVKSEKAIQAAAKAAEKKEAVASSVNP